MEPGNKAVLLDDLVFKKRGSRRWGNAAERGRIEEKQSYLYIPARGTIMY